MSSLSSSSLFQIYKGTGGDNRDRPIPDGMTVQNMGPSGDGLEPSRAVLDMVALINSAIVAGAARALQSDKNVSSVIKNMTAPLITEQITRQMENEEAEKKSQYPNGADAWAHKTSVP